LAIIPLIWALETTTVRPPIFPKITSPHRFTHHAGLGPIVSSLIAKIHLRQVAIATLILKVFSSGNRLFYCIDDRDIEEYLKKLETTLKREESDLNDENFKKFIHYSILGILAVKRPQLFELKSSAWVETRPPWEWSDKRFQDVLFGEMVDRDEGLAGEDKVHLVVKY